MALTESDDWAMRQTGEPITTDEPFGKIVLSFDNA